MESGPTVSVIVLSRDRPDALALCLTALGQQSLSFFEIIVVADAKGCVAAGTHSLGASIRIIRFDDANVAAARNVGVAAANGEIVAFIDDDAVPEPFWLEHLMSSLRSQEVAAAGGTVIGRNGITPQWEGRFVDSEGWHSPAPAPGPHPWCPDPPPGLAVRTEGTNMAFRKAILFKLGGFDRRFRFYLDDTDINLRLRAAGYRTALVPLARVHHRQLPSAQRNSDRVPRSLESIGESLVVFLDRHVSPDRRAAALQAHREAQRRRLLAHMVAGRCMPSDVGRLLRSFDDGADAGRGTVEPELEQNIERYGQCVSWRTSQIETRIETLFGWAWQGTKLEARALDHVNNGCVCRVYRFTPTALFHHVRYVQEGYWLQIGGLFGRSRRDQRLIRPWRRKTRVAQEIRLDLPFAYPKTPVADGHEISVE